MVNHGISTGALFLIVGMLYQRRHTRMIADFGGLARVMPAFSVFFVIAALSSIGLPGLNGFVGEFTILAGVFNRSPAFAVAAATGVILAAVYMLWMLQRVLFGGEPSGPNLGLRDLCAREWCVLIPMVALMFGLGLYPKPILSKIEPSARAWLQQVNRRVLRVEAPPRVRALGLAAARARGEGRP